MADACLAPELHKHDLGIGWLFRIQSRKVVDAAVERAILRRGTALAPDILLGFVFGLRSD